MSALYLLLACILGAVVGLLVRDLGTGPTVFIGVEAAAAALFAVDTWRLRAAARRIAEADAVAYANRKLAAIDKACAEGRRARDGRRA